MSEQYADNGGYKPLLLPLVGEELLEGRQYALTPLARLILAEVYGYHGVPTIVECLTRRIAKTEVFTRTKNLDTGEIRESTIVRDAQAASFRTYVGNKKYLRFELDIAKLEALAEYYDNSHKLPDLEKNWFASVGAQPLSHKFRGQSLRWWSKGSSPMAERLSSSMKKLDLSILD